MTRSARRTMLVGRVRMGVAGDCPCSPTATARPSPARLPLLHPLHARAPTRSNAHTHTRAHARMHAQLSGGDHSTTTTTTTATTTRQPLPLPRTTTRTPSTCATAAIMKTTHATTTAATTNTTRPKPNNHPCSFHPYASDPSQFASSLSQWPGDLGPTRIHGAGPQRDGRPVSR